MANGAHALKFLAPEPPATPATPSISALETSIGQATASAATAICLATQEYWDGGLSSTTRAAGGERIAKLFELQETTLGEIDFRAVAYREGAKVLRGFLEAGGVYEQHPAAGEEVIDIALSAVLDVLHRVTMIERAMAH